jgi:hypothetical protein
MTKPRIRKLTGLIWPDTQRWVCSGRPYSDSPGSIVVGYGQTPQLAFSNYEKQVVLVLSLFRGT